MSDRKKGSHWVLLVDAFMAFICANQVAAPVFHHLNNLGEVAVFAIVLMALIYTDGLAMQRGWSFYRRAGLKIGLFLGILTINIVSTLQHCDNRHENCHRAFSL